ncbi:MAG: AcrR family transcriptional regulator [Gammaproteobacteria bacterium]|jgi:AcrR family transcriptional regulator
MTARKLGRRPGKQNTRERILDEAEYIIAVKGPDGFTLQEVAERVGIRPPSVFSHFKGIPAVVEEVYKRVLEGMSAAIDIGDAEFSEETFRRLIRSYVIYLAGNPAHSRLILQQLASGSRDRAALQSFESGVTLFERFVGPLDTMITNAVEVGVIRPVSRDTLFSFISGAILCRLAWHEYQDWEKEGWDELVEEICQEAELLALRFVAP